MPNPMLRFIRAKTRRMTDIKERPTSTETMHIISAPLEVTVMVIAVKERLAIERQKKRW